MISEESNMTPAAYLPTLPYLDMSSADESSIHWHGQDNLSYPVDYSTLQPDYFHPSPTQDRCEITSQTYGASGSRALYATSDFTVSRRNPNDLPPINELYPPTPTLSPPQEFDSLYQQNERDRRLIDEGEETDDNNIDSEPYAQLICRALKSAPGHKMVLKDIYRWFEKNTNKARSGSKGWQNSIRHNLSMNGVSVCSSTLQMEVLLIACRVFGKLIKNRRLTTPNGDSSGYSSRRLNVMASNLPHDIAKQGPTRGRSKPDILPPNVSDQAQEVVKLREISQRSDDRHDTKVQSSGSLRMFPCRVLKHRLQIWSNGPSALRRCGHLTARDR